MRLRLAGVALALLASLSPTASQAGPTEQVEALRQFLSDPEKPEIVFAPSFLAEIPPEKARAVATGLSEQFGKPIAVRALKEQTGSVFSFEIDYERAIVSMVMTVSGDGPRPVIGWLVTGSHVKDDSFARLADEIEALPGQAAMLLTRIDAASEPLMAWQANEPLAIGSTFKLWVLAEATRQVRSGRRRWEDVIRLGPPSLPSGITQEWPHAAPMTLHSLATLMISISDNTATDTLVTTLGRNKVLRQADGGNKGFPVLLTREAFALKMPPQSALLDRYRAAATQDRAKLLDGAGAVLVRDAVDPARLIVPREIQTAEWFASPLDLVRTLRRLREMESKEAFGILSINPGLPPAEANRFAYVGYKGGSEAGVISQSFLVQTKAGHWYALSAIWNNTAALVDKDRFGVLVRRALTLLAEQ